MPPHQHKPVTNLYDEALWQGVSCDTVGTLLKMMSSTKMVGVERSYSQCEDNLSKKCAAGLDIENGVQ